MSVKVLIKSAGNKIKLIQEFQKYGAYVIADDVNPNAKALLVADSCDTSIEADLTIETRDSAINHPLWDKSNFYRFCRRHGFNTPRQWKCYDNEKFVVKKRFGSGSREVIIVDKSYIFQEHIPWPEYSIDYFSDVNGNPVSVIPRLRIGVVNGESTHAIILEDKKLIEESTRMGQEAEIKGPAIMQCFYDGSNIKWLEIAPRYGGGSWLTWHLFSGPKYQIQEVLKMRESNVQTPNGSQM